MFLQSNRTKNSHILKKSLNSVGPIEGVLKVMEVEQVVKKIIINILENFIYIGL
jgi:hypothetical protein